MSAKHEDRIRALGEGRTRGAQPCNTNALKHGRYSAATIETRRCMAALLRKATRLRRELLEA